MLKEYLSGIMKTSSFVCLVQRSGELKLHFLLYICIILTFNIILVSIHNYLTYALKTLLNNPYFAYDFNCVYTKIQVEEREYSKTGFKKVPKCMHLPLL